MMWLEMLLEGDERADRDGLAAAMRTLAMNLAVAGALCEAHLLGHTRGVFRPLKTDDESIKEHYRETTWRPNCEGAEAPDYGLVWNIKA